MFKGLIVAGAGLLGSLQGGAAFADPGQGGSVQLAECAFAQARFAEFTGGASSGDIRPAIGADWLMLEYDRTELAGLVHQSDRERGPDAPFAMGYRPDFARAIAALTDAQLDIFHTGLTQEAAIDCSQLDTAHAPFTEDMAGFLEWAEGQMFNPDPGAPDGAQTLGLSRPVFFDDGRRVLVAESYTYTPIPLSRPPSALLTLVVYVGEGEGWTHEASIVISRMG